MTADTMQLENPYPKGKDYYKQLLYNKEKGTILNRTPESWGLFMLTVKH